MIAFCNVLPTSLSVLRIPFLTILCTTPLWAAEIPIASEAELKRAIARAQPGDTLVLGNGQWPDVNLVFEGKGTALAPITLRGEVPGKVVLTGKSSLKIAGEYLVVEGLHFKNPDPNISDLIQFRKDSKQLAKYCRLTQCAVVNSKTNEDVEESRWLGMYGEANRVDHSNFEGKSGKGTTLVVWLGANNVGNHHIDHNYFGPRERLGENGGETMRIGDSKTSLLQANCVVESNLFERCNGEAECISNKSCGNIYRQNTFRQVSGTLTLRHGNACVVEDNCFLGNGANGTGGIRVIGEDHTVRNNYLERLAGADVRSAITLMMGIPNSPANRYFQVKRARIENNTIVDCKCPILIGLSDDEKATLPPIETTFIGNRVFMSKFAVVEARCAIDGITWINNQFAGESLGLNEVPQGISFLTSEEADALVTAPLSPLTKADIGADWTE